MEVDEVSVRRSTSWAALLPPGLGGTAVVVAWAALGEGSGTPIRGGDPMGISMGGYSGLLLAEAYPDRFAAAAAISPAVWSGHHQADSANRAAFSSGESFRANDVILGAGKLNGRPGRIDSGIDDPFHPAVVVLARAVPTTTTVVNSAGGHTGPFFASQEPPSLEFLSRHLPLAV